MENLISILPYIFVYIIGYIFGLAVDKRKEEPTHTVFKSSVKVSSHNDEPDKKPVTPKRGRPSKNKKRS